MARKKKSTIAKAKKKSAIARVSIKKGTRNIRINKKRIDALHSQIVKDEIMVPFVFAEKILGEGFDSEMDISVNVSGGGYMGQAEAVKAAIAKALVDFTGSEKLRDAYAAYDRNLIVDDVRRKEVKKPMRKGARAKYQKSYR